MVCYTTALEKKWGIDLSDDRFAAPHTVVDGKYLLTFESGRVESLDPESGAVSGKLDLAQPLHGPAAVIANKVYVGGKDGTLHVVDRPDGM